MKVKWVLMSFCIFLLVSYTLQWFFNLEEYLKEAIKPRHKMLEFDDYSWENLEEHISYIGILTL